MLEAEPAELRGVGTGDLHRHITVCADCATAARLILAGAETMDSVLAAMTAGLATPRTARVRRSRPAVRRWLPLGLAAVAVVAGVLLLRREPAGVPGLRGTPAATLPRAVEVDLAASPRDAAVFATADSTITVVWYF